MFEGRCLLLPKRKGGRLQQCSECLGWEKRKVLVRDGAAHDTHGRTFTARGLGGVAVALVCRALSASAAGTSESPALSTLPCLSLASSDQLIKNDKNVRSLLLIIV